MEMPKSSWQIFARLFLRSTSLSMSIDTKGTGSSHCGRYERFVNRHDFLRKAGAGFGLLGLADLLHDDRLLAAPGIDRAIDPMAPGLSLYPAKAKSIIWLF